MPTKKCIAVDMDGVCAEFNRGFAPLFPHIKFPLDDPEFPPVWHWPQHYGAKKVDLDAAWTWVRQSFDFWLNLEPIQGTQVALGRLSHAVEEGWRVYFITHRLGQHCQLQTIEWLAHYGMTSPTVLVAEGDKFPLLQNLGVRHFVDDRPSNLEYLPPLCKGYLADSPHNAGHLWVDPDNAVERVTDLNHALTQIGL